MAERSPICNLTRTNNKADYEYPLYQNKKRGSFDGTSPFWIKEKDV